MFDKGPRGPMSHEEADRYVRKNGVLVPKPQWGADDIECIDDRRSNGSIGYPGGALGITTTLFSGVNDESRKKIGFGGLAKAVEGFFGGMSGHSDEHNAGHSFPCAGCGHLQAIRNNPDEYGFGGDYVGELDSYIEDVHGRAQKGTKGFNIFKYFGGHDARAVMHIDDPGNDHYISLPPNDGADQVFVNHRGVNRGILDDAMGFLKDTFGNIFSHDPKEVYDHQLELTAKRLGADTLPHYSVSHNGDSFRVD